MTLSTYTAILFDVDPFSIYWNFLTVCPLLELFTVGGRLMFKQNICQTKHFGSNASHWIHKYKTIRNIIPQKMNLFSWQMFSRICVWSKTEDFWDFWTTKIILALSRVWWSMCGSFIMLIKVFRLIFRIIFLPLVLVFPLAGTGKVFVVADVIQIGPFRLA